MVSPVVYKDRFQPLFMITTRRVGSFYQRIGFEDSVTYFRKLL